jgi:hypothetical protein
MLGKNSEELVDKRKQELQLYLEILSKHPMIKYDSIFKAFLTHEEFEKYKQECLSKPGEQSIPMHSLKNLQLQDTFNYFYSSLKTRYFDTIEPEEVQTGLKLEEISAKILNYTPILEKYIGLMETRISFNKKYAGDEVNLINEFENIQGENSELNKVICGVINYNREFSLNCKASIEHDKKVLAEIKSEKLKLEGIILAISERKANIKQYNTLLEYSKRKTGNSLSYSVESVEKVTQDIDKVKERIMKINENLYNELETYSKNRTEGLSKILGTVCKADYEMGSKQAELALKSQKNFTVMPITDKKHGEELEVNEEYTGDDI